MAKHLFAIAAAISLASAASAATLSVTPDAQTYTVGEIITLSVFGDSEGEEAAFVFGRLLYDSPLASYVSSNQQPLTTMFGSTWTQGALTGGIDAQGRGFADAFNQTFSVNPGDAANPLIATATLLAESAGVLDLTWQTEGDPNLVLSFFSLSDAPGTNVTIIPIPEPSTLGLLAMGAVLMAAAARRGRRA